MGNGNGNGLYAAIDRLSNNVLRGLQSIFGGIDISRNTHPYIYGLNDPVDLDATIGFQGRGAIRITQESYFVATKVAIVATDSSESEGDPGDVLPQVPGAGGSAGVLATIRDDGNDVVWENVEVHSLLLGGSVEHPWYILPKPYAIERNTNITVDLTNLTADAKRIYFYMGGWKVKDPRSMNLTA